MLDDRSKSTKEKEKKRTNPEFRWRGYLKKQTQFIRIECCVMRIAKRNLKKQSQY
jgi:hypothetical protein